MWVKLALKLFARELRRGELTIIFAAIALAVLTVFSLSSITERIKINIEQKSADFIAADRRLSSNHELPQAYLDEAQQQGLKTAQLAFFSSMLFANDELVLGNVKAATHSYPLRGSVTLKDGFEDTEYTQQQGPERGHIWLTEGLMFALNVNVGDKVELGEGIFNVSKILVNEPDAPFFSLSGNKRALINYEDIAMTNTVQPGSDVYYRFLFAGEEATLGRYYQWLKPQLKENQNWQGIKDRQSPLGENLARSERFLLLAGLFGIMLAAVAMAVSAKRYCERQYDPVAMMKTLGGSRATIRAIFFLHLTLVTLFSTSLGLALGFVLQDIGSGYLMKFMGTDLPPAGIKPWGLAISIGVICALMFSLKPLMDLFDIPPLRVLRRNLGDQLAISRVHLTMSVGTVFALMWLFSGDIKITLILFIATAAVVGILFALSRLLFSSGRKLGLSPGSSWTLALATLQKRANANAIQLISFALAIKLMLFLLVLKNDLISDWQAQIPKDAPNAFFVNINEFEKEEVERFFTDNQIQHEPFFPVFMGRVNALNDEVFARRASIQEGEASDENQRQGVGRELNLTWTMTLPENNTLLEGEWFTDSEELEISISQEMVERIDAKIGDSITFLIDQESITAKITSIREVDWTSLKPNFFVIFNEKIAQEIPATYFTAAKLEADNTRAVNLMLRDYPTISMIDIDSRVKQAQSMISQVSLAISFVLAVVLASGALVLISQVQASLAERMQEMVILRTLGAKGRLIKLATLYEFLLLGAFAGFVAAIVSDVSLLVLQQQLFDMPGKLHPYIWVIGPASGAIFVAVFGYFMVASTMRKNTQGLLRNLA